MNPEIESMRQTAAILKLRAMKVKPEQPRTEIIKDDKFSKEQLLEINIEAYRAGLEKWT